MNNIGKQGILVRAATLVLEGWTTKFLARDYDGLIVSPLSDRAVCWCVSGALMKAAVELGFTIDDETKAFEAVQRLTRVPATYWNDAPGRTAEEVVDLLLRAAEAAS